MVSQNQECAHAEDQENPVVGLEDRDLRHKAVEVTELAVFVVC